MFRFFRFAAPSRRSPSRTRRKQTERTNRSPFVPKIGTAAEVEVLEERLVLSPGVLAVGSDAGVSPRVAVYNSSDGTYAYQFNPYADAPNFGGGVRVAVGYIPDINGNPFPIIITAPGPGLNVPDPVRIFSGTTGQFFTSYNPYPGFTGGIFLATADFDVSNILSPSRGFYEVVTTPDQGGIPDLRVFDLRTFSLRLDELVYNVSFLGGVRVATGNINPEDEIPDIITAPGPAGGPNIRVFSGFNGVQFPGAIGDFFAYSPGFLGGVYVAAGDFNGDGMADIVTGAGAGGGPHVRIFNTAGLISGTANPNDVTNDLNYNQTQFPFEPSYIGGVRVAAAYINSDNLADLIVTRGPGASPDLRVFNNFTYAVIYQGPGLPSPNVTTGVFPASGKLPGEDLRVIGGEVPPTAGATELTTADVQAEVSAALSRLADAGVPQNFIDQLSTVQFQVADLKGGVLGWSQPNGVVLLDQNAAGYGWFIDPTPGLDEEFGPDGSAISPQAQGRVDLLTVILHEFGHQLGIGDLDPAIDPHNMMTGTYNPGERRLPDSSVVDFLFGHGDLIDHLMVPTLL